MARFRKGQRKPARSGRKPGSRNKVNRSVREAIVISLNAGRGGAVGYMKKLKDSKIAADRAAYCHLLGRLIPQQLEADLSVAAEGPELVVVLPSNGRGPLPNETTEQYRERYERQQEIEREVEARQE